MSLLEALYIRQCIDLLEGLNVGNSDPTSKYIIFPRARIFIYTVIHSVAVFPEAVIFRNIARASYREAFSIFSHVEFERCVGARGAVCVARISCESRIKLQLAQVYGSYSNSSIYRLIDRCDAPLVIFSRSTKRLALAGRWNYFRVSRVWRRAVDTLERNGARIRISHGSRLRISHHPRS